MNTEPQLGGEMLAVALRNFDLSKDTVDQGVAQTIFGMTVKGKFTFSFSFLHVAINSDVKGVSCV
jgi:hypothetical protein